MDDRERQRWAKLRRELGARAAGAGFFAAGVAPARVGGEHGARLAAWLRAGFYGEMEYMAAPGRDRCDASTVLAGARAVLVFAASYGGGAGAEGLEVRDGEARVKVARYALGEDYHDVLKERLAALVSWHEEVLPGHACRVVADSAPLMERAFAEAAGLGFMGRNTMLIAPGRGSFFLLAEIVTTAPWPADAAVAGTCGTCTRCLDACPTGAFAGPHVLDARRCISYATIEQKSPLTSEQRGALHGWAFGCDVCQDVCPYNKSPEPVAMAELAAGRVLAERPAAAELLAPASNREFERRFARSPLLRAGRRRVQAAVRAAAGLEEDAGAAGE